MKLDDEQWMTLLDALTGGGVGPLRTDLAVRRFLYDGCVHFDRWAAPKPFVASPDAEERFTRFLDTLMLLEGPRSENVLTLRVHKLRNEVFRRHAHIYEREHEPATAQTVRRYLNSVEHLPTPLQPIKRAEFDAARMELTHILRGMLDGSLRTVATTALPYAVCMRPMRVTSTWQGLAVEILLEPGFQLTGGLTSPEGVIAQPLGSTRWQSGTTSVRIHLSGLLDPDMWTPALRALPDGGDGPFDGWPNSFTSTFSIVHDLFWQTRVESGVQQAWPPSPRDVESVTTYFTTAAAGEITLTMKRMGTVTAIVNPERSTLEVSVPELRPPAHWKRCRETAVSYLALGDTREALVFLNMGVESLLDARFKLLAEAKGDSAALETILGTKSVWAEAQKIVAKQFPQAAEKIVWPEGEVHLSRFTQIKLAHQLLTPRSTAKAVTRRYSAVSKGRNEVVHGTNDKSVPVSRVLEALEGFDWLAENFVPRNEVFRATSEVLVVTAA